MKTLRALLVVCAAIGAQFALAQDQATLAAIRSGCADDAQRLCAGVQPGGGRIVACLKEHKDSLSDRCKQAAGIPVNASSTSAPGASTSPSLGTNFSGGAAAAPVSTSGSSGASSGTSAGTAAGSAGTSPRPAPGPSASVAGEKFVERVIPDPEHGGMTAATIHLPEKWRFDSKIEWHYGWVEYPLSFSSQAENPDNAEAYFQYPLLRLESTEVAAQLKQYDKSRKLAFGSRLPTGALSGSPQPPVQALAMFIKSVRPNVANLKWIGQQDLPDLAKALHLDPWPNQHGVAVKVGYDLNGLPVEEAFFGVYYIAQGANAGPGAGMIKQTNWGFQALQSFRAPAGTLDKRMPMFCVIAKSFEIDPKWNRLAKAINDKMVADFDQKLKQGYDQIHAAQAIMEQTMKQEAAFQANFDKQDAALRSSGGVDDSYLRDGGTRSASDHFDDLIRGVDTVNDPSTGGTTQLSNLGQYHFTDGFGNYRTTDDPNYTPEKAGEVGSWTQMTTAP
ncbi:MAG: cysteine rich repeat-containing protein [Terracidiphilus sp.]